MAYPEASLAGNSDRLLWVDCEFTGLSLEDDVILEIAAIATDYRLEEKGSFSTFIKHSPAAIAPLLERNPWWDDRQEHAAHMVAESAQGIDIREAEQRLIDFSQPHTDNSGLLTLAGNSIHNDRQFLNRDLKRFSELLGYRQLDVSSVKLLVRGLLGKEFQKVERHRAKDDIRESIDELRFLIEAMGNDAIISALRTDSSTSQM